jgi:glycosyltransferase involved in cell wall biosynthesis
LVVALEKLLSQPERIAEMALAGRERVVNHYSIDAEARRIGEMVALAAQV